ncbi:S9 family peptidase [Asticcacaulis excentricus]|uniref:Peptidase S9B dipeptidylpeptidase IV domain protein n=1 Tax=Asticcacaulis excentricus (strain ATCC 15261 / DSM 4724 / KCTC 12464 / NCIMB 9791 / VKM B-1370 / CB 48) TaxID=573065 RepID=E8RSA8_ASTEC|nr:S9 family peptidase [Asticcacaulis excentricus]ADU14379.1 peptidase S9B dipeptidylpeptidase IV domain protein [Asticcacaulis excentricus CB 48]
MPSKLTLAVSAAALLGAAVASPVFAQATLTPERVFANPDLSGPKAVGARLSPDGTLLTFLKPKLTNATVQDLWAVDVKGGAPYVLVDADSLSSEGKELSEAEKARRERMRVSARGVVAYDWDPSSKTLLVPLDGDVYLVDRATKKISRATETPGDEVDAKLNPKGGQVAYVRDQTLYVRDLATGTERAITPKGEGVISYGVAEFIAQEELNRYTGYWWSPDGTKIVYAKVDESPVDIVERFEINGTGTRTVDQRYPKAGRPNAIVTLFVHDLKTGTDVPLDLGANSDIYLARVNWSPDGQSVFVQRLSRDQKTLDLLQYLLTGGAPRTVLTETSDTWVELNNDLRFLKDGRFLWASERDGNNHLYLYDKDGKLIRQVTRGDFPVAKVAAVDEAKGEVWFESSYKAVVEMGLYKTSFLKPSEPVAVTKAGGWWSTDVSPNAKAFIGTYTDPQTPAQTGLYDATGKRVRWIEENALDAKHPYFAYKDTYSAPEFGKLEALDGEDLHWLMLKPRGFDPAKKYPVIVSIYGGPARQDVRRGWVSPANRLFQEAGYIVFTLDNRGTPNRSVKFQRAIYKQFGGPDIDDQIMGAKWLQSLPYVDPAKIGIMGWSQGGFVTLMALTAKDTPFVAGAAGAPPTEWGLYDTAYTERYMSTPQANAENYAKYDVVNRLDNLKPGSLLLMHGMADDNVILQNTTRVVDALQKRSIPFELMLFPGDRHGIRSNEKNLFRYRLYLDFFDRKLKK